jgi:hypothetical protein
MKNVEGKGRRRRRRRTWLNDGKKRKKDGCLEFIGGKVRGSVSRSRGDHGGWENGEGNGNGKEKWKEKGQSDGWRLGEEE